MLLTYLLVIIVTIGNSSYSLANIMMAIDKKNSAIRKPTTKPWLPIAYYVGLTTLLAINATMFATGVILEAIAPRSFSQPSP